MIRNKKSEIGIEKFDELLTKPIGFCVMLSIIYLGFNQLEFPKEWNLYDYDPNSQDNKIGLKMILHKGLPTDFLFIQFFGSF